MYSEVIANYANTRVASRNTYSSVGKALSEEFGSYHCLTTTEMYTAL